MQQPASHPALRRLDAFVGEWAVEASIGGQLVGRAWAKFEWAEDGVFLVQHADGEAAEVAPPEWVMNSPFPLTTIIGLDDPNERYTMLYADSRDVFRVYQMSLHDDVWKLWRDAPDFHVCFTGTFSDDLAAISGPWLVSRDGSTWRTEFDLSYTKIMRMARRRRK